MCRQLFCGICSIEFKANPKGRFGRKRICFSNEIDEWYENIFIVGCTRVKGKEWLVDMEKTLNIPKHVAIILDGNGRWAKAKGLPRNYGHIQGAKTVEEICEVAYDMGIQYLTVYAFSTENWNRPKEEVDALMKLLRNYMKNCLKRANKNNTIIEIMIPDTKRKGAVFGNPIGCRNSRIHEKQDLIG